MKPGNPGFGSIDEETGDSRSDRKRRKMQLTADPHLLESEQALFPQLPPTDPLKATLNPGLGPHQQRFPVSRNSSMMMMGPPPQLGIPFDGLDPRGTPPSQQQDLGSIQQQLMAWQNQSSLAVGVSNNNAIGNAVAQDARGGAAGSSPHYLLGEHYMEVHHSVRTGSPDPPQEQPQLLVFQAQQLLQQAAATQPSFMMPPGWNFQPGFFPQPVAGSNILNVPPFVPEANATINSDAFVSGSASLRDSDKTPLLFGAGRGPSIDFETTTFPGGDVKKEGNVIIGRIPVMLFMRCDTESLSEYQCLVRMQIEMFEAGHIDLESKANGRNKPIMFGQVGIRCRHCSTLPPRDRKKGATYFPAKLNGLYQTAQSLAFGHLRAHCKHIPAEIRELLVALKEKKSSAGGGKDYWGEGVRIHGVYEDEYGLRFKKESK